jgi:PKD domain
MSLSLWSPMQRTRSRVVATRRRARPQIEGLETRQMLSITSNLVNGQLLVTGDNSGNTITVDHQLGQTFVNGKPFFDSSITNGILIQSGSGVDTVNIRGIGRPTTIDGQGGRDIVNLGRDGEVERVLATLTITNPPSFTTLNIDDSTDVVPRTVTMGVSNGFGTIDGLAPAQIRYKAADISSVTVNGGIHGNYTVSDTIPDNFLPGIAGATTTLNSGSSGDHTVNVQRTTGSLQIDGQTGATQVFAGLNNSVQFINAQLIVDRANLDLNDQADGSFRQVVLSSQDGNGFNQFIVDGLAPGRIRGFNTFGRVAVNGSSAGNRFIVTGTRLNANTSLNLLGNNEVNVDAANFLDVRFRNGSNTVNVSAPGIGQELFVNDEFNSTTTLTVNDDSDTVARNVTLTRDAGRDEGTISGLAPGFIFLEHFKGSVTVKGGRGGNTFTVADTLPGATTTISTGTATNSSSFDSVNVERTTGALIIDGRLGPNTVRIGQIGSVRSINGAVTVAEGGRTDLIIDDAADTVARNVTMSISGDFGTITNVAPAPIKYAARTVTTVTINGSNPGVGKVGNTFTVQDTVDAFGIPVTTLNTGNGIDTVNVQRTTGKLTVNGQNSRDTVNVGLNGNMQSIKRALTITNAGSFSAINLNNQADNTARTVTLNANNSIGVATISDLAPALITYTTFDLSKLTINTGAGADTFTVNDTASSGASASTVINSGGGNDTVTIRATTGLLTVNAGDGNDVVKIGSITHNLNGIQGAVTVNGQAGTDTLNIDDQGSLTPHVYTQTATTLSRSGAATITFSGIENLQIHKGPQIAGAPHAKHLALTKSVKVGESATLTGRLEDPDKDVKLTLTVDWGDGSKPQTSKPGLKPFALKHKYVAAGTYTVRVIWTDGTGQSNSQDLSLAVTPKLAKPALARAARAHAGHRH